MKHLLSIACLALLLISCGEKTPREKALEDTEVQTFKGAKLQCQILGGNEFSPGRMDNFNVNDSVVLVAQFYKYKNDMGVVKNDKAFGFYIFEKEGYAIDITSSIESFASQEELDKCLLRIKYKVKE